MAGARFLDPSSVPLKRQSGGNIWATLAYITKGAIIVALLVVVGIFFLPVIQTENRHKDEQARLQRSIADAMAEQEQLKLETEQMKNNPAYVEHIARDELNMGKPGEVILHFDSYQAPPPESKADDPASADDASN